MAEAHAQEIELLGQTIEYDVRYSPDSTGPRIDIDIHGVSVVLPESDKTQPSDLLKDNAAWVIDKQRTYESYREDIPERSFEAGEEFPFLGKDHELVIEPRSKHEVSDGAIRLRKSAVEQSSVKQVLENFYRSQAREHFVERLDHYAESMSVSYESLELRNQRTRWGSCSTGGTISLNWRLIMAPPEVVDYLVVHELAHLIEQHHGDEFWDVVSNQIPEFGQKAGWLKDNSVRLIFDRNDI
ncbi:M48 family metallopeptidase [Haloarcula nitratireducens]|uniref:M48 family metallopeptidase n=1 Tax=Haloarcula nitratireducens TaxID=2487749 RepID=A0AAW4PDC3_9EURY|nr:SprT family zinc-dependent metalloprotease [Halomicroarcula nitratireducens]MBX0295430.1 M48 family metallopeptidase [Halomicroarcula nitratireducens]